MPLVFYLIRKGNKTRGMVEIEIFVIYTTYREWGVGADVAKWIKAVDCESTMRGFNSRRSPIKRNNITPISFFFCKDEETNSIFSPILFTTATKNQIITIFIPFSTSSSKCRITPRGCGFFSTNWGPPFTTPMGMVYRVHNYSSYYRTLT